MMIQLGKKYKTRGGWTAFMSRWVNGTLMGWCRDSFGTEEPWMGIWDENTGKCLKRGEYRSEFEPDITKPFDIVFDDDSN
jgi:hypothetical protein